MSGEGCDQCGGAGGFRHCAGPSDCLEVEGIDDDGVAHSGLVEVEWESSESSWGSEFSVELIGAESHG